MRPGMVIALVALYLYIGMMYAALRMNNDTSTPLQMRRVFLWPLYLVLAIVRHW